MRHLDLFSGIGGFSLALESTGHFETVGFVEWDKWCRKVLSKHWPDVKQRGDITKVGGDEFGEIDIITGGFPCQPFSQAGKRRGKEADRWLWPEMLRIIDTAKPRWVIAENVAGIIRMELDTVLADLETIGYTTGAVVVPAVATDAPHRRDRVWIVANATAPRFQESEGQTGKSRETIVRFESESLPNGTMADTTGKRMERNRTDREQEPGAQIREGLSGCNRSGSRTKNRHIKSRLGGVVDGVSRWLDEPKGVGRTTTHRKGRNHRLKMLENAIVPQVAFQVAMAIIEVERGLE